MGLFVFFVSTCLSLIFFFTYGSYVFQLKGIRSLVHRQLRRNEPRLVIVFFMAVDLHIFSAMMSKLGLVISTMPWYTTMAEEWVTMRTPRES